MNLFEHAARYPQSPGFKDRDTAKVAAESMKPTADILRDRCLARLRYGSATADEVAAWMGASVLSVRPRITELFKLGLIADTGKRRKNESGRPAKVWGVK